MKSTGGVRKQSAAAPDLSAIALEIGFWLAVLLALALRISLLSYESRDYATFTGPWYEVIRQQGGVEALRSGVSNYTPLYIYGLILVEWLFAEMTPAAAIKLVGLPFDFLCAWFVGAMVELEYRNPMLKRLAILAVLFAPTVVLNGSFWGQVDVIAATGLAACVYYLMAGRDRAAMIGFGLAFAFKLQAFFLAPFLALMILWKRVQWQWLLLIPGVYLAMVVPAWIAGRPLSELLTIYVDQAGYYQRLTSNAPHVYQWLPGNLYDLFFPAGMIWGAGVVLAFCLAAARAPVALTREAILRLALLSVLLVPYCLPKMHERYFFAADVLSLAYAFYAPRYAVVAVLVTAASLLSYAPFLFGNTIVPLPLVAFLPGIAIVLLLYRHGRDLSAHQG